MEDYFQTFGGVRDYLGGVVEQARKDGYTETILGRRRYLPDLTTDNRQRREMAERMALNAPIQGSAADIIKVAMLNVHRALAAEGLRSRMLLQVHDELVLEVADGERAAVEELVRREMGAAYALAVPLEVSVGLRAQLGPGRALTVAVRPGRRTRARPGPIRRARTVRRASNRAARGGWRPARRTRTCAAARTRARRQPGCGRRSAADDAGVEPLAWDDPLPARAPAGPRRRHLRRREDDAGRRAVGAPRAAAHRHRRALPRPRLGAAARVRRGRRRARRGATSGSRSGSTPSSARCLLARADLLVWLDLTRAQVLAPARAAHPAAAAAPRRAVERQRRAAAVDDPHRARPHPALGLAHPPEDRGARAHRARLRATRPPSCACATAGRSGLARRPRRRTRGARTCAARPGARPRTRTGSLPVERLFASAGRRDRGCGCSASTRG